MRRLVCGSWPGAAVAALERHRCASSSCAPCQYMPAVLPLKPNSHKAAPADYGAAAGSGFGRSDCWRAGRRWSSGMASQGPAPRQTTQCELSSSRGVSTIVPAVAALCRAPAAGPGRLAVPFHSGRRAPAHEGGGSCGALAAGRHASCISAAVACVRGRRNAQGPRWPFSRSLAAAAAIQLAAPPLPASVPCTQSAAGGFY